MRHLVLALVPIAMALAGAASARPATAAPFAVVELFSSEGCSSCPPAEQLLAEIAADARRSGRNVLTLEFHVDYWNSGGWTDPFSARAYTQRQEQYERALDERSLYTPQMIVNGTHAFVGSDRGEARRSVEAALARPATVQALVSAASAGGGTRVEYQVAGAPDDAVLCVAVVESGLVSRVLRGENTGRTLAHESVVRAFTTRPLAGHAAGSLELDAGPPAAGRALQAIAFVQDPRTMAILGAGRPIRFAGAAAGAGLPKLNPPARDR